jgi:hypothetical protein
VRDNPNGFRAASSAHANDVGHPRGPSYGGPSSIGLLNADFESKQSQLVDDVRPRARIGRSADRAAADCSGKHPDMGLSVL